MEPNVTIDCLPILLRDFLSRAPTLGLATVDAAGRPHAANLNFVADDELDLLFVSRPDTDHCRHIAARPDVAVTVHAPFESPEQIRGVQLRGVCEVLDDAAFEISWCRFCEKHPSAVAFEAMARREHSFYRVRPRWVRWIDNRVQFGFKLESSWPVAAQS